MFIFKELKELHGHFLCLFVCFFHPLSSQMSPPASVPTQLTIRVHSELLTDRLSYEAAQPCLMLDLQLAGDASGFLLYPPNHLSTDFLNLLMHSAKVCAKRLLERLKPALLPFKICYQVKLHPTLIHSPPTLSTFPGRRENVCFT